MHLLQNILYIYHGVHRSLRNKNISRGAVSVSFHAAAAAAAAAMGLPRLPHTLLVVLVRSFARQRISH